MHNLSSPPIVPPLVPLTWGQVEQSSNKQLRLHIQGPKDLVTRRHIKALTKELLAGANPPPSRQTANKFARALQKIIVPDHLFKRLCSALQETKVFGYTRTQTFIQDQRLLRESLKTILQEPNMEEYSNIIAAYIREGTSLPNATSDPNHIYKDKLLTALCLQVKKYDISLFPAIRQLIWDKADVNRFNTNRLSAFEQILACGGNIAGLFAPCNKILFKSEPVKQVEICLTTDFGCIPPGDLIMALYDPQVRTKILSLPILDFLAGYPLMALAQFIDFELSAHHNSTARQEYLNALLPFLKKLSPNQQREFLENLNPNQKGQVAAIYIRDHGDFAKEKEEVAEQLKGLLSYLEKFDQEAFQHIRSVISSFSGKLWSPLPNATVSQSTAPAPSERKRITDVTLILEKINVWIDQPDLRNAISELKRINAGFHKHKDEKCLAFKDVSRILSTREIDTLKYTTVRQKVLSLPVDGDQTPETCDIDWDDLVEQFFSDFDFKKLDMSSQASTEATADKSTPRSVLEQYIDSYFAKHKIKKLEDLATPPPEPEGDVTSQRLEALPSSKAGSELTPYSMWTESDFPPLRRLTSGFN